MCCCSLQLSCPKIIPVCSAVWIKILELRSLFLTSPRGKIMSAIELLSHKEKCSFAIQLRQCLLWICSKSHPTVQISTVALKKKNPKWGWVIKKLWLYGSLETRSMSVIRWTTHLIMINRPLPGYSSMTFTENDLLLVPCFCQKIEIQQFLIYFLFDVSFQSHKHIFIKFKVKL